jgi:hypothetical protein
VRTVCTGAVEIRQSHSAERKHRQRALACEIAEASQADPGQVRLTGLFQDRPKHREIDAEFRCVRQFSRIVTGGAAPRELRPLPSGHQRLRWQVHAIGTDPSSQSFVAIYHDNAPRVMHTLRDLRSESLARRLFEFSFSDLY